MADRDSPVTGGFLHHLDPRVKVAAVVLVSIASFVIVRLEVVFALLVFIAVMWVAGGLPARLAVKYLRVVLGVGLFLIITQALWYPGTTAILHPVIPEWVPVAGGLGTVTAEGLYWGFVSTGRLLTLLLALPLLTSTTKPGVLTLGLVRMGVPYRTAFLATAALNLVPSIRYEAESIIQAQTLRGAAAHRGKGLIDRLRGYSSIALPLGISSMRKAHLMGVAMDARAFGSEAQRTFVREVHMTLLDWGFLSAVFVVTAGAVIWSIVGVRV